MIDARSPVKVLHIAESARGGVGSYLNEILPELSRWNDTAGRPGEMRVILPAEDRFMLGLVPEGEVMPYDRGGRNLRALGRLARASWNALASFRPDIVHLHSTFAGAVVRPLLIAARLRLGLKPKVVYTPHAFAFQIAGARRSQKAVGEFERQMARITDRIIVLSETERAECLARGFPASKLELIYNGIRIETETPVRTDWHDERLKVFFVGRFDRQKGLDVLIDVARKATDKISVRCAGMSVVSNGGTLDLPDNIEVLGWLNEAQIAGQLAEADVVAIPSRWEGCPMVAIEAMRAGVPIVASRVGGLPEMIVEGVTGRLVPSDDADALLTALTRDDDEVRARMGAAGRKRFLNEFTARHSTEHLGRLYSELLYERSPSRR